MKKTKKTSNPKQITSLKHGLPKNRLLVVIAVLAFAGVGASLTFFSKAATGSFVKVATHPQAAVQPTTYGKTLATLESWNGKLYSGFGDWGINSSANTGPITITPFDGTSFAAEPEITAKSEALHTLRKINGKLYAPATQRKYNYEYAYTVSTSTGLGTASWLNPYTTDSTHLFDMVTLTGSENSSPTEPDLWLIGSNGNNAIAKRSLDGGATWQLALSVPPSDNTFARFYGAGVFNGKLYIHAVNSNSSYAQPKSKVFDPVAGIWSDGPVLGRFTNSDIFAGKMTYVDYSFTSAFQPGYLTSFDGTTKTSTGQYVYDYTIDRTSNTVYALTTSGVVKSSKDLVNWSTAGTAPTVARSIAIYNDAIYVGGTDSALYKLDLSAVPPPPAPDTIAPVVTISQPINSSRVGRNTTVKATATDNVIITKMEVYIDGVVKATSTTGSISYRWSSGKASIGNHTITVKVYDAANNVGESSVIVVR